MLQIERRLGPKWVGPVSGLQDAQDFAVPNLAHLANLTPNWFQIVRNAGFAG
jgi:hypothetical protein